MRPTGDGRLHIGNLMGALVNWAALQDDYQCHFMVADWHALMSEYEAPKGIRTAALRMVREWLAAGLDPARSVLFIQSEIPAHVEMAMLFSMFQNIGRLERNPTFKEMVENLPDRGLLTHAFLGYPVLQAADILVYRATHVPVGEDQVPHIEITRDIARRFNQLYGTDLFPEPNAILTPSCRLLGTDNRKMSKSYGNAIYLADTPQETAEKVSVMITDPARVKRTDPGHPEICTVFSYHKTFSEPGRVQEIERDCRAGTIGCVQCKKEMAASLNAYLAPLRDRLAVIDQETDVSGVLEQGKQRATATANETLRAAKECVTLL